MGEERRYSNRSSPRSPRLLQELRGGYPAVVGIIAVVFFLNLLIGVYHWLPARAAAATLVPIPEAMGAVALAFFLAAAARRSYLWVSIVIGFVLALVFAFGLGQAFFRFVYREDFSMWRNVRFLPSFLEMVSGSAALARPGVVVALSGALLGALAGVFGGLLHGATRLSLRLGRPTAVMIAGLALFAGALSAVQVLPAEPAGLMLARQLRAGPSQPRGPAETAGGAESTPTDDADPGAQTPAPTEAPPESPEPDYAFPVLKDEDVYLFIIESYGHTLFTRSDHYELIAPVYTRLDDALREAGFATYSHFMKSPAFGGRSWLADATILAGTWIGDQEAYDTMWDTDTRTLVRAMEDAGYRTVLAAPGMTFLEEGFREFFPYDRLYLQGDLGYEGKRYSFGGGITDQFLLDRIRRLEPAGEADGDADAEAQADSSPFFGVYVMVSSHVPFNVLPPYIEDWSRIGDGSVYDELPRRVFDNDWLRGGEYPEGYTASIEYSLRATIDYIVSFLEDDAVAVVIGDHQPRIPIAERSSTFSVPVHVVSRNAELVQRFSRFGFREGLEPSQPAPHPGMDELYGMFLEAAGGRTGYAARGGEGSSDAGSSGAGSSGAPAAESSPPQGEPET